MLASKYVGLRMLFSTSMHQCRSRLLLPDVVLASRQDSILPPRAKTMPWRVKMNI